MREQGFTIHTGRQALEPKPNASPTTTRDPNLLVQGYAAMTNTIAVSKQ